LKFLFLLLFPILTLAANVKITELPSGTPAGVASNDVFPYVSVSNGVTRKLTIGDLINVPTVSGAFLSSSLDNGYIFVGNSLGAATGVPLSGDASISNAGALTVNSVGGATAANISSATSLAIGSTSINTPSTIIRRDASGNFAANVITAALTGNVTGNVTGALTGNADTATALAANPTDCGAGEFANAIAANGNLTCAPGLSNPMTTADDLVYGGTSGSPARLAIGTAGAVLEAGSPPSWSTTIGPTTGLSIVGTNTNDDAAAGVVGEYVTAALGSGSATSFSSGVPKTITSISLTAGDWDVSGVVGTIISGGATMVFFAGGPSGTTNVFDGPEYSVFAFNFSIPGDTRTNIPTRRFSVASTTTIYLIGQANFSSGSISGWGSISARRVR